MWLSTSLKVSMSLCYCKSRGHAPVPSRFPTPTTTADLCEQEGRSALRTTAVQGGRAYFRRCISNLPSISALMNLLSSETAPVDERGANMRIVVEVGGLFAVVGGRQRSALR